MNYRISMHSMILILVLGFSAAEDLAAWKISNRLLIAGVVLLSIAHILEPMRIEGRAVAVGGVFLILMVALFRHHMTGGGDVKLFSLILFSLPNRNGLYIMAMTVVLAGATGFYRLICQGMFRKRMRYLRRYIFSISHGGGQVYYDPHRDGRQLALPMAGYALVAALTVLFIATQPDLQAGIDMRVLSMI